jgi:hypothetical protein
MDDPPYYSFYLGVLTRRGWWWSTDRRVLIHPAHPEFRIWLDPGSGNLGFSDRMAEAIMGRMGRA